MIVDRRRHYAKYTYRDYTGYVLAPWFSGVSHELITLRCSYSMPPWGDRDVHLHRYSEEYFFVFQGELNLYLDGSFFTIQSGECVMVKPQVHHAVVGGDGSIEHFVLRVPASDDREFVGEIPSILPPAINTSERELPHSWGYLARLREARNQNCWLFGVGQTRFFTDRMCFAYINFPKGESAEANKKVHRHRLHIHQKSWEYYTVLQGIKVLQIEVEQLEIHTGETLEVPPGVKHTLQATRTPFEGFTSEFPS